MSLPNILIVIDKSPVAAGTDLTGNVTVRVNPTMKGAKLLTLVQAFRARFRFHLPLSHLDSLATYLSSRVLGRRDMRSYVWTQSPNNSRPCIVGTLCTRTRTNPLRMPTGVSICLRRSIVFTVINPDPRSFRYRSMRGYLQNSSGTCQRVPRKYGIRRSANLLVGSSRR